MNDFEQWLAEHPTTRDVMRDYIAWLLRRLPTMTTQTIGANVRLTIRTLVDMAENGEPLRHVGWADDIALPQEPLRQELLAMVEQLGTDWHLFDETALADSMVTRTCEACGGPYHLPSAGCVRPKIVQTVKKG